MSARSRDGFEVRDRGGAGALPFSYRVVAWRGDIEVERLAKVEGPPAPLLEGRDRDVRREVQEPDLDELERVQPD